jgi:hypothetical protein
MYFSPMVISTINNMNEQIKILPTKPCPNMMTKHYNIIFSSYITIKFKIKEKTYWKVIRERKGE